jgi:acetolactate synthase small subunit
LVQDKINNFYTDYQYSIFLYEQIKLLIKNKKYTKKIEKKSEQAFSLLNEISKDIRVSDITPYYFVRDELNKVTITNLNSNFASMFVPNLYFIPFDSEKIKSLTEDLKLEIRSIIEVHNIESIKDSLSKELNENKTKSIEVLSIFA